MSKSNYGTTVEFSCKNLAVGKSVVTVKLLL